jgi:hypothetical protein
MATSFPDLADPKTGMSDTTQKLLGYPPTAFAFFKLDIMNDVNEELIWVTLADLFFLDAEPDERDFINAAELLKSHGWVRAKTQEVIIKYIAPHAAGNLGYLIFPIVAGNWSGFDQATLAAKVRRSIELRKSRPDWHFCLSDWWFKRMLVQLDILKLLDQLPG